MSGFGGTLLRMLQMLAVSALAGGAAYFVLWYCYLGLIWLLRTFETTSGSALLHADPAPYELPAALVCMLLAAAYVGAKSFAEAESLQAQLEARELADEIAAIEELKPVMGAEDIV